MHRQSNNTTAEQKTTERRRLPRSKAGELRQRRPPFPRQHQESPGLESDLDPLPRYQAQAYKAAGKLQGKVALITGGDSGIGRAVSVLFAREGALVAINYLAEEESDARKTLTEVEAQGGKCELIAGDLAVKGFCQRLVEETVRRFGRLDILVSNAAHQRRKQNLDELTDEELEYTFTTNILRISASPAQPCRK